jgi:hypothetical protein
MFEQRPTFVARKNPGSGWGVDILWPDGETEVIKGFITEHDATRWIVEHSKAWQGNMNDKLPKRPRGTSTAANKVGPRTFLARAVGKLQSASHPSAANASRMAAWTFACLAPKSALAASPVGRHANVPTDDAVRRAYSE